MRKEKKLRRKLQRIKRTIDKYGPEAVGIQEIPPFIDESSRKEIEALKERVAKSFEIPKGTI